MGVIFFYDCDVILPVTQFPAVGAAVLDLEGSVKVKLSKSSLEYMQPLIIVVNIIDYSIY